MQAGGLTFLSSGSSIFASRGAFCVASYAAATRGRALWGLPANGSLIWPPAIRGTRTARHVRQGTLQWKRAALHALLLDWHPLVWIVVAVLSRLLEAGLNEVICHVAVRPK